MTSLEEKIDKNRGKEITVQVGGLIYKGNIVERETELGGEWLVLDECYLEGPGQSVGITNVDDYRIRTNKIEAYKIIDEVTKRTASQLPDWLLGE